MTPARCPTFTGRAAHATRYTHHIPKQQWQ